HPLQARRSGYRCTQPVLKQSVKVLARPVQAQQSLALVTLRDRYSLSWHETVPGWRPRYVPTMSRGNAAREYLSYGAPMGSRASHPPACQQEYVLRSCATSSVDSCLNLLT